MKKLLSVLALAGSVAGIASTTTACGQDPTQSQAELGIRTVFGLEDASNCAKTWRSSTDVEECKTRNAQMKLQLTQEELSKVELKFTDWKKTMDQETTVEWEFNMSISGLDDEDSGTAEVSVRMVKDSGSDWKIDNLDGLWG